MLHTIFFNNMAKVHTQFSHVSTLSHPTFHYIKSPKSSIRITCKITTSHHGNVTATASPFTEAHSVPMCVHSNVSRGTPPVRKCDEKFDRKEENEIILQLPELHEMLGLLKNSRRNVEDKGDDGVGNVYLVGTGPGDPELLTLKAYRLLQSAHLVLYDRLVSSEIMDMVHPGARLLYVGKTAGYHSRTQDEIHQLLLSFAEAGATVVRLKGGDPLIFGRGGEEMDFLQQQGITVKVIPGITAASGIAADLGIPLTHRGVANSVRFLTGHSRKGGTDPIFVEKLSADSDMTLVVYMGLATLPALVQKLVSDGLSVETPAVAVERGTTPQQREVFSTLKELPDAVKKAQLVSPTLIIIGNVVALSTYWSEKKFCSEQGIDACVASEMS